jgi:hypothetical protein
VSSPPHKAAIPPRTARWLPGEREAVIENEHVAKNGIKLDVAVPHILRAARLARRNLLFALDAEPLKVTTSRSIEPDCRGDWVGRPS